MHNDVHVSLGGGEKRKAEPMHGVLAQSSCANTSAVQDHCVFRLSCYRQGIACHSHLSGCRTQLQQSIRRLHMWPPHGLRIGLHRPLCRARCWQLERCSSRVERWTQWWLAGHNKLHCMRHCPEDMSQQQCLSVEWL